MKLHRHLGKEIFIKRKNFRMILAESVSLVILTFFNWGKVVIFTTYGENDTGIRFTALNLYNRLTDITHSLRLFLQIEAPPFIRTLGIFAVILWTGAFVTLFISLLWKQTKARARCAGLGFFLYALVCVAFMVAAPIVDHEVEIASAGAVTSIIRLTAFPYVSFFVAVLSFLHAFRSGGSDKRAHPMTTRRLAISGVLAAFVLLTTSIVQIPVPAGYVHPGDGAILFSALLLGPYAAVIGGIGSALADLLSGYVVYVLPTFLIKALMGGLAGFLVKDGKTARNMAVFALSAALMVFGYYIADGLLFSYRAAVASVIPNLLQGAAAVAIGIGLSFSAPSLKRFI